MFADLNIPWPEIAPNLAYAHVYPILQMLDKLNYDIVALNAIVPSIKAAKQILTTSFTSEIYEKLKSEFPKLKILKRVTLKLDENSTHQNIAQLIEDKWEIIAVIPNNEKQLQTCTQSLDIDLITIDTKARLPFVLRHKSVCSAVARGVKFELCYSGATVGDARQCISNAGMLFRASRNRGILVSSGSTSSIGLRAPMDIINLVSLWGLRTSAAQISVSKVAEEVATQGILRSRSAKQAILPDPHTPTLTSPHNVTQHNVAPHNVTTPNLNPHNLNKGGDDDSNNEKSSIKELDSNNGPQKKRQRIK